MKIRFLQPLEVDVEFDDRRYKLGDVIDVTLRITPRRNAFVRKGWVELICDENWTDVRTVTGPFRGGAMYGRGGRPLTTASVSKRITLENTRSYIRSSAVFVDHASLSPSTAFEYHVQMDVGESPPPNAGKVDPTWRLNVTVDVAYARDAKKQAPVTVVAASRRAQEGEKR